MTPTHMLDSYSMDRSDLTGTSRMLNTRNGLLFGVDGLGEATLLRMSSMGSKDLLIARQLNFGLIELKMPGALRSGLRG
jgi:hypothetical protein